jgi:hypothetical protein
MGSKYGLYLQKYNNLKMEVILNKLMPSNLMCFIQKFLENPDKIRNKLLGTKDVTIGLNVFYLFI